MFRGLFLTGVVVVGTAAAVSAFSGDDPVTVVRVIDGDTITAKVDGAEKRLRLLNVDTPELGRNGAEDECLAQEATTFLASLLPSGQEITLEYDTEKQDRYDRELVGVFLDNQLVNAEIARQGFGVAVQFGDNRRFYPEVADAEKQARAEGIGVHELPEECSVPRQTESTIAQVSALLALGLAAMNGAELDLHEGKVAALLADVRKLRMKTDAPSDFAKAAYDGYRDERAQLDAAVEELEDHGDRIDERRERLELEAEEERQRLEAERRAAAEAERQRVQAEKQERVSPSTRTSPNPAPQPPAPTGGVDTYTGCRAYGGNYALTTIDAKGRPYAKIDCTTKVQIG